MANMFRQIVLTISVVTALVSLPVTAQATESFFNTTEDERTTIDRFKHWIAAISRYDAKRAKYEGPCTVTESKQCLYLEWRNFIDSLRSKPHDYNLLVEVNKFLNPPNRRYVTDPKNWDKKDYWEAPDQFFNRLGDCEDYAITKYMTLRDLGFPAEQLRVAVVRDTNLKLGHAILAVFMDGKTYILDNQIPVVKEDKKIVHYRVHYSLNEDAWWRHKRVKK